MKVVVYETYGPPEVLKLKEVERPVPGDNEVLIKSYATAVTKFDCWMRSSTSPPGFGLLMRMATGFRKPKQPILGTELAGEIETVGKDVTLFKKGDQVNVCLGMSMGAYVEYLCFPENGALALKPANVSYEESVSLLQGGLTALYFLRNGKIQSGQKVLIFGASGGLGIAAVQLAKYFGAEVTGVCSGTKVDLVKSLGADRVIDYRTEDFTKNGQTYDIIFDTVGKSSVSGCKRSLKSNGYYLLATFGLPKLIQLLWLSKTSNKKIFMGTVKEKAEDLLFLKEIIEGGKLKPVIDRRYSLEQIAEAHRYAETGQKKGSVVITVGHT
ncbi:MAG: NAD(P)-dependent alcohol dehydrogenase [Spirochaetia bacterium]|nr:NAD(P)-dependent alcohol dehydrogenase [Spirochaetia bacterium]